MCVSVCKCVRACVLYIYFYIRCSKGVPLRAIRSCVYASLLGTPGNGHGLRGTGAPGHRAMSDGLWATGKNSQVMCTKALTCDAQHGIKLWIAIVIYVVSLRICFPNASLAHEAPFILHCKGRSPKNMADPPLAIFTIPNRRKQQNYDKNVMDNPTPLSLQVQFRTKILSELSTKLIP